MHFMIVKVPKCGQISNINLVRIRSCVVSRPGLPGLMQVLTLTLTNRTGHNWSTFCRFIRSAAAAAAGTD